jgi:uncharacterized membrane protein
LARKGTILNEPENRKLVFTESRLRSLVKAVSYRILSLIGTGILSWIITRDFMETVSITIAVQVYLTVLYYSWERMWDRFGWGRRIDIA